MFGLIAATRAAAAAASQYKVMKKSNPSPREHKPGIIKCRCCGSSDYVIHNKVNICSYCRTPKEEQ